MTMAFGSFKIRRIYSRYKWKIIFITASSVLYIRYWQNMSNKGAKVADDTETKKDVSQNLCSKLAHNDKPDNGKGKPNLGFNKNLTPVNNSQLTYLLEDKTVYCDGAFAGHAHTFAVLRNVLIYPSKAHENNDADPLSGTFNRSGTDENINLSKGYFNILCKEKDFTPNYEFKWPGPHNEWLSAIDIKSELYCSSKNYRNLTGIFVERRDYAHLYFTMLDIYNTFLMSLISDLEPQQTQIVWMDRHPKGGLDGMWKVLFGNVIKADDIKDPVVYKRIIWNISDRNSLLNQQDLGEVPVLSHFRHFVLAKFGLRDDRNFSCTRMRIVVIWRRNYVAHPRNPEGSVYRKIANEGAFLRALKTAFSGHEVVGKQLEILPMREQLRLIAGTDILIGVHGAGLTHALFLPAHAVLIELFPTNYRPETHFYDIARWRRLLYATWNNLDVLESDNTSKEFVHVKPWEIIELMREIISKVC